MSDDDDQRRAGGESVGRREGRSLHMRELLAAQGIQLDSAKPSRVDAKPRAAAAPIDRERIRAILIDRGAPEADLEWMTASCPSEAAARAYSPTVAGP